MAVLSYVDGPSWDQDGGVLSTSEYPHDEELSARLQVPGADDLGES